MNLIKWSLVLLAAGAIGKAHIKKHDRDFKAKHIVIFPEESQKLLF